MTGQIFCGIKQQTWIEREKGTRMLIASSSPRSLPKLHRVEDAEDPVAAEGITVVDQLPTVAHSAEEEEEACPRQVGSVGMRPQQRVETIRAFEEIDDAELFRMYESRRRLVEPKRPSTFLREKKLVWDTHTLCRNAADMVITSTHRAFRDRAEFEGQLNKVGGNADLIEYLSK